MNQQHAGDAAADGGAGGGGGRRNRGGGGGGGGGADARNRQEKRRERDQRRRDRREAKREQGALQDDEEVTPHEEADDVLERLHAAERDAFAKFEALAGEPQGPRRAAMESMGAVGCATIAALKLSKHEVDARVAVLNRLEGLVHSIWPPGGPPDRRAGVALEESRVAVFGSYASGLGSKGGDIDAVIEGLYDGRPLQEAPREIRKDVLGAAVRTLRRTWHANVEFIAQARVPVLKFTDRSTGVAIDLLAGNSDGYYKSAALGHIVRCEPRFGQLVMLVKKWAKSNDINDSSSGTLNSFSLTMLCAFHLQRVSPPVLPPLRDLVGDVVLGGKESLLPLEEIDARCRAWAQDGPCGLRQSTPPPHPHTHTRALPWRSLTSAPLVSGAASPAALARFAPSRRSA